ncbi:glucosaminidase domain-containing protein [Bacillus salipaludis]|uniref:Glucosaminidase domain-containing protein n=1 Tax=Bacillus salipaludis TaxID=2547811 RepID=A0AA90TVZ6_9BACI|nr:glucosaminidase domain-containing protein [Bacillus salipaludis]MDQ6598453.1 glucosaminidase domain-containing protein [Bacillus salipaludis]
MDKKMILLSACFLTFMTAPIAANAKSIDSKPPTDSQKQIQDDLTAIKQQKVLVQEEMEATAEKIKALDQQITTSKEKIQKKENELKKIQGKMNRLNKEEKRITTLLNNRKQEFKDRVAAYYRTDGEISFLNVVLSVNSFGEFIDHFFAYDKIVNKDKEFIEEYIANQNKVASIKGKVQSLQKSTMEEKAELEEIKAGQEKNKKEKEKLSKFLEKKKKQLEKEEQEKTIALELLQKKGKEILDLINHNGSENKENVVKINSIIAPFVPDSQKLEQVTGVPASITLGQIILESSGRYNGLSGLAYKAKNLFGIKGTGTAGSVKVETTEYVKGEKIVVIAEFAKYKTYYDSMLDHANLLLTPRYQKYLKDATNIVDYAHGIHDAGYATDPEYANKLLKIIYQYDLWKLDEFND